MSTMYRKRMQLSVAAVAALAIVAVAAVMLLAGGAPAQAQDDTPPPLPCGVDPNPNLTPTPAPDFQPVPENPIAEVHEGHYALFDAYWDSKSKTINNNLCPPSVVHSTEKKGRKTVEVTTRTATTIDIEETVIVVGDRYKVDVVNREQSTNSNPADVGANEINAVEYPFIKHGLVLDDNGNVKKGTQVWWLRLDDPDTSQVDETSKLILGFSTGLFDAKYWSKEENGQEVEPFEYEFESQREPGISVSESPHFFAFSEPQSQNDIQAESIWDSTNADTNTIKVPADEHQHVQWLFTQPGTYRLQVHIKGHVRDKARDIDDSSWERITPVDDTVTSEVKTYTIHVGPVVHNNRPLFQVDRSIPENASAGDKLGAPIKVANNDFEKDTLTYALSGRGSQNFSIAPVTSGQGVQLSVAPGARLDYERTRHYPLELTVSDRKDPEGNADRVVDNTIALKVNVGDVPGDTSVTLKASDTSLTVGDAVAFTLDLANMPNNHGTLHYAWSEQGTDGYWTSGGPNANTKSVTHSKPGTRSFVVTVTWFNSQGVLAGEISSDSVPITWSASN